MAKEKFLSVKLDKEWSGHKTDEIVTVEDYTALSMVKKGYGQIVKTPNIEPKVETADAPPAQERAVVTPQVQDNKNEQANLQLSAKDINKLKDDELKDLAGKNNIDISKCKNIKEVQKAVKTALNIK